MKSPTIGRSWAKWKRSMEMPAATMKKPVNKGRPRGPRLWNEYTMAIRDELNMYSNEYRIVWIMVRIESRNTWRRNSMPGSS